MKFVASSEKSEQDELGSKKDYSNRIEQEKMDQLRSMKLHFSLKEIQTIKNQENYGNGPEMEIWNGKQKACC